MSDVRPSKQRAGFSFPELMIVIGVGLIITVVAVPVMSNVIANMKLRSNMTSLSGLLQNTRAIAVQQNGAKTACHLNRSDPPYSLVYFAKNATDCTTVTANTMDSQVELEAPIIPYVTPSGPGAPPPMDNATLGLLSSPLTSDPSFNSRGLPCSYSGGICTPNTAFIQYFKDSRFGSSGGWAAISISPAGRIRRWFFSGSAWTS
jgi:prepilin-type N-terminal cleavage/methylation domain-containing protein